MKKSIFTAALAAVALVATASGSAFAGLTAVGAGDLPDSFFRSFSAGSSGQLDVLQSFNRFDVTVLGNVSFTVGGDTFNITNKQNLEDIAAHDAIDTFSGVAGWSQTSPPGTPGVVMFAQAAGGTVNAIPLNFRLNFGPGEQTDGMHVRLDFYLDGAYRTSYVVKYKQTNSFGNTAIFGTEIVNTQIPLPPAVWSGLAMMAGLGVFLAKRRNDRKTLS